MAEILIVRHGQASFGTDNYDQLSALGFEQARILGNYLFNSGVVFDRVYSGTLERQIQTAETVLQVFLDKGKRVPELIRDPRWNELQTEEQVSIYAPLIAEAKPEFAPLLEDAFNNKKSFQKLVRATFDFWVEHPELGGQLETWLQADARVAQALAQVHADNGSGTTAGIFSSGGIIAVLTAQLLNLPSTGVYPLFEKVINTSITRLLSNTSKVSLSTFNEYSYLTAMKHDPNIVSYR